MWGSKKHASGKTARFQIVKPSETEEIEENVICSRCKNSFEKSRTVEEDGFTLCNLCAGEFNEKEAQMQDAVSVNADVAVGVNTKHTIKPGESSCAGCGAQNRNLCPHCMKCWNCRDSDCPRKR